MGIMKIKTFDELATPDQRALAFTPMGLSTMGLLKPEDAATFQQQVIAHCDLAENVELCGNLVFDAVKRGAD